MDNCQNLNVVELVSKVKEQGAILIEVNNYLENIYKELHWAQGSGSLINVDFMKFSIHTKLRTIRDLAEKASVEEKLKDLIKKEKHMEAENKHQKEILDSEREELLNAWNNFQSWKQETSKNLVKDFNSKFDKNG